MDSMNRKLTAIFRMSDTWNDDFVPGAAADRINIRREGWVPPFACSVD